MNLVILNNCSLGFLVYSLEIKHVVLLILDRFQKVDVENEEKQLPSACRKAKYPCRFFYPAIVPILGIYNGEELNGIVFILY